MNRIVFRILLGVCLTVCAIGMQAQNSQPKEITLEDIWVNYKFYPRGVSGFTPMPDPALYSVQTKDGLIAKNFATGETVRGIVSGSELKTASGGKIGMKEIQMYKLNEQQDKLLIGTEVEYIYRRSYKAIYYVYDLNAKKLTMLADTTLGKQSFATFSPDGKKIAFVRENNLFINDLETNKETAITTDGKFKEIINGMADWVYEEELDMSKAFEWSPDSRFLAFLRFDESRVKEFNMIMWGKLYPDEYHYKYPKAGEDNSLVTVHLYDVQAQTLKTIDMGDNSDCYIPRLYWLPNAKDLVILKMNRHQNEVVFHSYNTANGQMRKVYTDVNDRWLDITDEYYFLKDNKRMIVTSERNGFNHLYMVDMDKQGLTPITSGEWEVASVCAVDEKNQWIYYLSNESGTLNRDLYRINFNGKGKKLLTSGNGWNTPTFNGNATYYRNVWSDLNTPPVYTLHKADGKQLNVMEDNHVYKERMEEYMFSKREIIQVPLADVTLNGWMLKPNNFDPNKKYPLLMYVYGGPGSQEVSNSFARSLDFAWYQMLAQKGYIVVCVDNRGTAGRGDNFKKIIYKQMGKYESDDQIAAAKYFKTLPYIDPDRVGIWGWSFGGYLSSLSLFKGEGTFKTAMAVAPVTTWRYYDNIYTERFLQTPQENPSGYDDNSPITWADKMQGNYLLIHGTADDNVHFQNSMDLVTALNAAGKQYECFFYPNKNHSIYGGNTRYHLYTKLTDFLLRKL